MKYIKNGNSVDVSLTLPNDLHWKIFGSLLGDLGVNGTLYKPIFGAVRNRDMAKLMECIPTFEPRSILKRTDNEKKFSKQFFLDYQLGAFLKKFPFKGNDTKSPALKKFFEAEEQCRLFNTENYKALLALNSKHPDYFGVIEEIRADVLSLIGSEPPIKSIVDHAKHGPGVSLGDSYKEGCSTEYYKWNNLPYSVTLGALPYAKTAIEADPRWMGALDQRYRLENKISLISPISMPDFWNWVFEVVDGSRITNVPKTALTDRTIAIEPLLNIYLQLGVDHVFKVLLRKHWGYDLSSQERNQKYAEEASVTNLMVTLDLKGASDTVALYCCFLLLPMAWYELLLDLRSPKGVVDGIEHPFEKISSMGNGFTFALESLIFGALARCAIRRTKSERKSAVYGDDLIVPTTASKYLCDLLNMFGFQLNIDKSFADGPFRESCGKDFFLGYNVRPLFLKNQLRDVRDLFYVHNALFELEQRCDWTWQMDFSRTRALIRRYIPCEIQRQFRGPASESLDTHLFTDEKLEDDLELNCKVYWKIVPKPMVYNKRSDFFFRKLMNQLKKISNPWTTSTPNITLTDKILNRFFGLDEQPQPKWDRDRRFNTGNAFDVTKRSKVLLVSTRCRTVQTIRQDLKSLATNRFQGIRSLGNAPG